MQPIWNEPALTFDLTLDGRRTTFLVASELHIGLESHLARRGAYLLSRTQRLADHLLTLASDAGARRLVLLGDIKHKVAHLSMQERRDVPRFFERMAPFEQVDIAIGNHDVGLRSLVPAKRFPNVRFHEASGFTIRGKESTVGFLHGHAWPKPSLLRAETLLVGHTHAAVAFVDEKGESKTEWAWLRGKVSADAANDKYGRRSEPRVIVFPPFNPLCGGTALNREGLLGPFSKLVDASTAEVYLLDGRSLGRLAELTAQKPTATRRRRSLPESPD